VYLGQILDETPAVAHVGAHALQVWQLWRRRHIIATCQRIAAEGYGDVGDEDTFADGAEAAILTVCGDATAEEIPSLGDAIVERTAQIFAGRSTAGGIGLGLPDMDRLLGPLLPGNLVVLAAHSGIGKTSLAMQGAIKVSSTMVVDHDGETRPSSVLVFSQEMSRAELADRSALAALDIDTSAAARGTLGPVGMSKLANLAERVRTRGTFATLRIDDRGNRTPAQIRATARREAVRARRAGAPLRLVVVDYVQLCDGASGQKQDRREREVAFVAEQLKALAKELGIVVMAVAQLNEDARAEHRLPRGEDLRESKAIRAAADKVILLHNEAALERRAALRMGEEVEKPVGSEVVDIIVDKNRGGREGRTCAVFWPETSSFSAITPEDAERHIGRQREAAATRRGSR
jgi:replicative DNA helicase